MRHRPGLLLSAAVTVAVPGAIAVAGVLAQQHAARGHLGSATAVPALGTRTLASPFPTAPPPARTLVRDAAAGVQHVSGVPVTMFRTTPRQQALGSQLLGQAADAGQTTSYQGVEVLSQSGVDGTVTMVSHVWHRGGGLTVTQTSNGARRSAPQTAVSYDPDNRTPEGVFGLTRSLVTLLGKHYVAIYQGTGSALGRRAAIVAVYRFNGSLAARFWLDRRTLVPLRRELFDGADRLISREAFVHVSFGRLARQPAAASAAGARAGAFWAPASFPARVVATLASQGLRVPGTLPGDLPLYSAQSTGTGTGQVVALQYSDGLYVNSLFVQRGTLTPEMTGWRTASLAGHRVYVSGRSVTWAGDGSVYTMVADTPPQTVTQDIAALPPEAPPGLLARLGRGLSRLASLLNPFG